MASRTGETVLAELAGTWSAGSVVGGMAADDAEAVAGLREGSEAAYDWLIGRYHSATYSLVYRLLSDPSDAQDTVQEVFLKVFRGIGGFKGECSLKTWIYRIAVHEASNQRRWWRRHRQREIAMDAPLAAGQGGDGDAGTVGQSLPAQGDSPFDAAAAAEMQHIVGRALAELPIAYRTVVVLRDIEDLSYEEIAQVLEMRVGTVKSRLARGREALKPKLARYIGAPAKPAQERRPCARDGVRETGPGEPVLAAAGQHG